MRSGNVSIGLIANSDTTSRGITFIYEKEDGSADHQIISFDYKDFKKIIFISQGQSEIDSDSERTSFYNPKVKEIRIRRDFYLPSV
jgi:hypothetical protein